MRPHTWSGAHGVPGGTERWEHGSYRPRRALEAALLVVLAIILAPKVFALAEILGGAFLILVGLVWLVIAVPRRRRLRHPLLDGLLVGIGLGWLIGKRRRRNVTTVTRYDGLDRETLR